MRRVPSSIIESQLKLKKLQLQLTAHQERMDVLSHQLSPHGQLAYINQQLSTTPPQSKRFKTLKKHEKEVKKALERGFNLNTKKTSDHAKPKPHAHTPLTRTEKQAFKALKQKIATIQQSIAAITPLCAYHRHSRYFYIGGITPITTHAHNLQSLTSSINTIHFTLTSTTHPVTADNAHLLSKAIPSHCTAVHLDIHLTDLTGCQSLIKHLPETIELLTLTLKLHYAMTNLTTYYGQLLQLMSDIPPTIKALQLSDCALSQHYTAPQLCQLLSRLPSSISSLDMSSNMSHAQQFPRSGHHHIESLSITLTNPLQMPCLETLIRRTGISALEVIYQQRNQIPDQETQRRLRQLLRLNARTEPQSLLRLTGLEVSRLPMPLPRGIPLKVISDLFKPRPIENKENPRAANLTFTQA